MSINAKIKEKHLTFHNWGHFELSINLVKTISVIL